MRLLALIPLLALLACGRSQPDAAVSDISGQSNSSAISELQANQSDLQDEVDSLRRVVARHDSLLARLAQQANLSMPMR